MRISFLLLVGWLCLTPVAFGAEWQIGAGRLWPRLHSWSSTYHNNGSSLSFSPSPVIEVQGAFSTLGYARGGWVYQVEQANYRYQSTYNSQALTMQVEQQRLGVSLYWKRELAALQIGLGVQESREFFLYNSQNWEHRQITPYGQWTVEAIFGAFRWRGGQTMGQVATHQVYTNQVSLALVF